MPLAALKFAIQINCSPTTSGTAHTAYQFVKTALILGHQVIRVFFYQEGVCHAVALNSPPDDELQLTQCWSALAADYNLDLVVCVSAAQRRGLLSVEEAQRRGRPDLAQDIAPGFRISGLGQLVEARLLAERFIVFH